MAATTTNTLQQERAPRVLLLSPRAPVTLEWARLFLLGGAEVHVAASMRWHLCRFMRGVRHHRVTGPRIDAKRFHSDIRRIVESEEIDLIVPTCEEVFWAATADDLGAPLFAPDADTLHALHDKHVVQTLLAQSGLPALDTRCVLPGDLLEDSRARVFKKRFSRFANHVLISPAPHDARRVIDADAAGGEWLSQQRVVGREVCTYSIARDGELIAHATYDAPFRAGVGASIYFRPLDEPAAEHVVRTLVAALNLTGQVAFDFIIDASGVAYALECNPRATSGLHLFAERTDVAHAVLGPDAPATALRPRPEARSMLLGPMLLFGWQWWRQKGSLPQFVTALFNARDVMFRWRWPSPLVVQLLTGATLVWWALVHRRSTLEASTVDIEFNQSDLKAPPAQPEEVAA